MTLTRAADWQFDDGGTDTKVWRVAWPGGSIVFPNQKPAIGGAAASGVRWGAVSNGPNRTLDEFYWAAGTNLLAVRAGTYTLDVGRYDLVAQGASVTENAILPAGMTYVTPTADEAALPDTPAGDWQGAWAQVPDYADPDAPTRTRFWRVHWTGGDLADALDPFHQWPHPGNVPGLNTVAFGFVRSRDTAAKALAETPLGGVQPDGMYDLRVVQVGGIDDWNVPAPVLGAGLTYLPPDTYVAPDAVPGEPDLEQVAPPPQRLDEDQFVAVWPIEWVGGDFQMPADQPYLFGGEVDGAAYEDLTVDGTYDTYLDEWNAARHPVVDLPAGPYVLLTYWEPGEDPGYPLLPIGATFTNAGRTPMRPITRLTPSTPYFLARTNPQGGPIGHGAENRDEVQAQMWHLQPGVLRRLQAAGRKALHR